MSTIVLIIGLISTVCQILFALSVNRLRLLLFSLGASLMFLIQYALLGQWIGFYSGLAGTVYTVVLALAYRYPRLQARRWLAVTALAYLGVFLTLTDWAHFQAYEAIPLVAGVTTLYALHAKNMTLVKGIMLGAGAMWLTYEFANTMYTQMIGEGFEFFGNLFTLVVLLRGKRREYSASIERMDTELVKVLTGAIRLPEATALTNAD